MMTAMRNLLQKMPFPVEFAVVLAGAFGYAAVQNALALAEIYSPPSGPTEFGAWRMVAFQTITVVLMGAFLWVRGWKPKRLGLDTEWRDGLWGLALAAGSFFAILATAMLVGLLLPGAVPHGASAGPVQPVLSPYVVCAAMLVNAFYQEVFAAGYLITALKEKGHPDLAINIGVAIRILVHLGQGVTSVLVMVPIGLVFGTWYARKGRLWPLILAHILLNAWNYAHYIRW